ncbi:MAG: hypothetical protein CV089_12955 [Nitrospira sp. WS110]|nr:hypothetical protein [Nitrospira sp. WS110]
MDVGELLSDLWLVLSQDVTLISGIQSPMVSWIGAAGILALSLWQSTTLLRGRLTLRRTLSRFHASLLPLVLARQQFAKDWIIIPTFAKNPRNTSETTETRRDLDDLQALDRVLRAEPALAKDWCSYRKTLAVEQSAWFLEPSVHSQRSATDFFSFEVLCANQFNMRFYRQLPSFLTGVGLLFTFIAILIGLSKLHANGLHIEGIQGLINGLSGKFVTSIVGLASANAFTLLEHSVWHSLEDQHRTCLSLLDELFPQKAVEHHSQPPQLWNGAPDTAISPIKNDGTIQLAEVIQQRLSSTVTALTAATQALTTLNSRQSSMKSDDLAAEIAHEVQRALKPIMKPVLEAMQELTRSINSQSTSVHLTQAEIEGMFHELKSHVQKATDDKVRTRGNG